MPHLREEDWALSISTRGSLANNCTLYHQVKVKGLYDLSSWFRYSLIRIRTKTWRGRWQLERRNAKLCIDLPGSFHLSFFYHGNWSNFSFHPFWRNVNVCRFTLYCFLLEIVISLTLRFLNMFGNLWGVNWFDFVVLLLANLNLFCLNGTVKYNRSQFYVLIQTSLSTFMHAPMHLTPQKWCVKIIFLSLSVKITLIQFMPRACLVARTR